MAAFNEILVGRFNKGLNALFGIKSGAPAPSLAGDVTPVFSMDEQGRNDVRFLDSWYRYGIRVVSTPQAAAASACRLLNPQGSGVIAVIEKLKFELENNAAAATVQVQYTNVSLSPIASLDAVIFGLSFDGRNVATPVLLPSQSQAVNPAALSTTIDDYAFAAAAGSQIFDILFLPSQEFVLLPNTAIQFFCSTVNSTLHATFWWRERRLEDSELR